jgi:hypothetical protein
MNDSMHSSMVARTVSERQRLARRATQFPHRVVLQQFHPIGSQRDPGVPLATREQFLTP